MVQFEANCEPMGGAARKPWWMWPNILALDAPCLAILWQVLVARGFGIELAPAEPMLMGLTIWLIYVTDYLLDGVRAPAGATLPLRHDFYRSHPESTRMLLPAAALLILALAAAVLDPAIFRAGLWEAVGVAAYFVAVHFTRPAWRPRWPRELALAVLFAAGTFLPFWVAPGMKAHRLAAPALVFTLLCWMNSAAIESWEWAENPGSGGRPSPSARWLARHLRPIALSATGFSLAAATLSGSASAFFFAAALSNAALFALSERRRELSGNFVRVAADMALLAPAFVLWLDRWL